MSKNTTPKAGERTQPKKPRPFSAEAEKLKRAMDEFLRLLEKAESLPEREKKAIKRMLRDCAATGTCSAFEDWSEYYNLNQFDLIQGIYLYLFQDSLEISDLEEEYP